MKKTLILLVLTFILFLNAMRSDEKVEYMARFLISLTRYIEWPSTMKSGNFKIGVVGDFNVYKALCEETMGLGIQNRNVDVMNLSKVEHANIADFHILILSGEMSSRASIDKALEHIGNKPTLLVTEGANALQFGSGINFLVANGKIGFEINKSNLNKNGIRISNQMEAFAQKVVN